jgi:glycosyltransferase involved in cell wall biosynthesis
MKIALLSYEYPAETGFGGIGTYTWYQARALVKLGHEVHVVAGSRESSDLRGDHHDGVKVWRYRGGGPAAWIARGMNRAKLWWSANRVENAVNMLRAVRALERRHRFDLIEMPECGGEGVLLNRRTAIPTLVKFHSPAGLIMEYYDVSAADASLCPRLERRGIEGAAALTSCSRFLREEVRDKLGVRRDIEVIANGIDLELFDSTRTVDVDERFGLSPGRPVVFFSGRMERRKGIEVCAEIASAVLERYPVDMVFAGEDLFGYMERRLLPRLEGRALRGSFRYVGKLGLVDIRSCLRRADIVLIPSLWENCPYSCLEAMAAGCAVVSSDAGGLPELIRHGENGLVARCNDPASFSEAIGELLEDAGRRRELAAAARTTIERSYLDTHIAQLSVDYYRRFASG